MTTATIAPLLKGSAGIAIAATAIGAIGNATEFPVPLWAFWLIATATALIFGLRALLVDVKTKGKSLDPANAFIYLSTTFGVTVTAAAYCLHKYQLGWFTIVVTLCAGLCTDLTLTLIRNQWGKGAQK